MKYQSEIVKEIIDSRGHEKSSLHYQSECIETWIKEAEGSYPKLCDYEGEWLNYINENPIGEFPYETLTDVTTATVNNVVPFAYKSAILKGQTEKFIGFEIGTYNTNTFEKNESQNRIRSIDKFNGYDEATIRCKSGYEAYLITDAKIAYGWTDSLTVNTTGREFVVLFRRKNNENFTTYPANEIIEHTNLRAVDENSNALKSVKMPVLTTSNEDGTKTIILTVNEEVELGSVGEVKDTLDCLTGEVVNKFSTYRFSDTDKWSTNTETSSQRFTLTVSPSPVGAKYSDEICIISDKLEGVKWNGSWNKVNVISCSNSIIAVYLPLGTTIEQCKELMRNSIAIYRTTESVKTVDLSVVNKDGTELSKIKPIEGTMHITTSGTPINPLFSGEIPVEAITQNLNSFIRE